MHAALKAFRGLLLFLRKQYSNSDPK
jgi:hypothetical protein